MLIHSPVNGHLGCLKFGAIISKAVMNIAHMPFCEHTSSFFVRIDLRVNLLGHKLGVCLMLVDTAEQFF